MSTCTRCERPTRDAAYCCDTCGGDLTASQVLGGPEGNPGSGNAGERRTGRRETPPRDPRVQQMIDDPETYFAEARAKARAEVEAAEKREGELRRNRGKGKR